MNKVIELVQDKVTKNTVRYTEKKDNYPIQIYVQQSELPKPFPEKMWITLSAFEPK